jgi:hypothetical protein
MDSDCGRRAKSVHTPDWLSHLDRIPRMDLLLLDSCEFNVLSWTHALVKRFAKSLCAFHDRRRVAKDRLRADVFTAIRASPLKSETNELNDKNAKKMRDPST